MVNQKRAPIVNEPFAVQPVVDQYATFTDLLYANLLQSMISKICFEELVNAISGGNPRYGGDFQSARMWFSNASDQQIALPIYPLGSFNRAENSFLWICFNPDLKDLIPEEAYRGIDIVLNYANDNKMTELFSDNKDSNLIYTEGEYVAAGARALTGCPTYIAVPASDVLTVYSLVAVFKDELKPVGPLEALFFPIHQLSLFNSRCQWPALNKLRLIQEFAELVGIEMESKTDQLVLHDQEGSSIEISFELSGDTISSWKEDIKPIDQGSYSSVASLHRMGISYE